MSRFSAPACAGITHPGPGYAQQIRASGSSGVHYYRWLGSGDRSASYRRYVAFDDDPVLAALDLIERMLDEALCRMVERLRRELPARVVDQLRTELEGVRAAADPRLEPPLSVAQVAERLGRKPRWVYDHQAELGVVRHGGRLAFPAARIEQVRSCGLSVVPQRPDAVPTPRYVLDRAGRRDAA